MFDVFRKKKPVPEKKISDWPSESDRDLFGQALENLKYAKTGVQAKIAKRVGCKRQYVHQVLAAVPPFQEGGYKARMIWETLPVVLAEEEDFAQAKKIIQALEQGDDVLLITNDALLVQFLKRRVARLCIDVDVRSSPSEKHQNATEYFFELKNKKPNG